MNQEDELLVDEEYLFNNISFKFILERVTERGYLKLSPSEVIDVRLGRSEYQFIHSISLSIINELESSKYPSSAHLPSLIEFKLERSIIQLL